MNDTKAFTPFDAQQIVSDVSRTLTYLFIHGQQMKWSKLINQIMAWSFRTRQFHLCLHHTLSF